MHQLLYPLYVSGSASEVSWGQYSGYNFLFVVDRKLLHIAYTRFFEFSLFCKVIKPVNEGINLFFGQKMIYQAITIL
ncbi:MAG: hypothetical protein ACLFQ0_21145, partial [Cyclobacteriaceae bacterium]